MMRVVLMMLFFLPFGALAIDSQAAFDDPELQARYEKLTDELRCLVCQNQTIADSNAGLAQDLRREVKDMLTEGASDKEILNFMVERYGNFVRYRPPLNSQTVLLWSAPILLLLGGAIIGIMVLRRRAALMVEDDLDEDVAR